MGPIGSASCSYTPLMLLKSNSLYEGGSALQSTLCIPERTSSDCAASQSTAETLLGLIMGATKVAEITG